MKKETIDTLPSFDAFVLESVLSPPQAHRDSTIIRDESNAIVLFIFFSPSMFLLTDIG